MHIQKRMHQANFQWNISKQLKNFGKAHPEFNNLVQNHDFLNLVQNRGFLQLVANDQFQKFASIPDAQKVFSEVSGE